MLQAGNEPDMQNRSDSRGRVGWEERDSYCSNIENNIKKNMHVGLKRSNQRATEIIIGYYNVLSMINLSTYNYLEKAIFRDQSPFFNCKDRRNNNEFY